MVLIRAQIDAAYDFIQPQLHFGENPANAVEPTISATVPACAIEHVLPYIICGPFPRYQSACLPAHLD